MSYANKWEFNRIEKVVLKGSFGNIDRAKDDIKKSLKIYEAAKPKNDETKKEVQNRISILKELLKKYN